MVYRKPLYMFMEGFFQAILPVFYLIESFIYQANDLADETFDKVKDRKNSLEKAFHEHV